MSKKFRHITVTENYKVVQDKYCFTLYKKATSGKTGKDYWVAMGKYTRTLEDALKYFLRDETLGLTCEEELDVMDALEHNWEIQQDFFDKVKLVVQDAPESLSDDS